MISSTSVGMNKGTSSANGQVQAAGNNSGIKDIKNTGRIDVNPILSSAMFTTNMNPSSKYLLETRSRYISLGQYFGSDYFTSRVGYSEIWDRTKRLGDAYYENQLLTRALAEKLGTAFINGKSNQELVKSMMDNAAAEGARLGLTVGQELTQDQINSLNEDIVWYVTKNVNGVEVLAPQVYLSSKTRESISDDTRNRVGGINGTYVKTKDFVNDGTKWGNGGVTYVEANTVRNETTTNLLSEISGDRTFINSVGNIENIGGKIKGNEIVALISENGNVINNTTKRKVGFNNGEFDRSWHEEIGSIGQISSNGLTFIKGNSYESTGGMLSTDHLALDVNKVNLNALSLSGEDKFGSGGSSFTRYAETTHLGAGVSANSAEGRIGNLNLRGSSFIAEDTTGLAVGNVRAESVINTYDIESRQSNKSTFASSSSHVKSHQEENVASNLQLGKNAVITGNVEGIGSNIVLGENTFVGGKVTTDSRELHNSYYEKNRSKGFNGGVSHGTISAGYGKSQNTYDEKSTVNAKSNLQVGNGSVLNRGAEITATNFEYGNIQINNGDVKYGARIDTRDVHTSSRSSGFTISAGINSPALDRAKQVGQAVSQIKNGDTAGGAMEAINAATGTIKGLADNQGTRQTNYVNGSVGAKGARDAMANSNFYANIGVNAGFTRSRSNSSSHTESAAVTTMKPLNENSSITYNNVNNITYQGTQAQGGTFIYNNVANIQKEAVELHNSYSSSSSNRGINAGATIGYGHKIQTTGNGGSISASQSNQNTVETVYANGNFKNVNEVHNNTGSMVLNGFNQEGGKLTGNIGKVEVISRQNTSTTTGSSSGMSLGISANGVPSSVNINGSRTNGDRAFVDNQSTFIVGEGSNLHVGTLENTGAVVGKEGNSTFKIDSYIGKDIQNHDTMKTTGGSLGISTGKPRITNVGFHQDSRDKQGITRNTVVGDVEVGESSGDEINRDLGKANEVTKDEQHSANINVESQTIEAITNPMEYRKKIEILISEIKENFNFNNNTKFTVVQLPDPNYSEQLSDEIISYDGENKFLYGNYSDGRSVYGEDVSSIIHKVEDIKNGKISENDVFVIIKGKKYFIYLDDAHYDILNEVSKYSSRKDNNFEYGGIIYKVTDGTKTGYMYTPANRDKGDSVNLGLAEKFYINPLKKSLDKQVKLEIVAGYHSHGASYDLYFDKNIPGYNVTTGDGKKISSGSKKSANYFSLIPLPHIPDETNEYLLRNNVTSDTLYTYYHNRELSVVTPRKIGINDTDIIKPSIWIFTPVDVIRHRGTLKYLGVSDDYRNPLNKNRFSTEGGSEAVPNIIFNNQFHDLNIIKSWNEELEEKIRGD
ncbi:hemagglutinin repeat-containing protein [Leptotrichia trevisanii]